MDPLAVDPLDMETVEPGRGGVEPKLSLLRDKVDIRRSQDDLEVPVLLDAKKGASCTKDCFVSSCERFVQSSSSCTPGSGTTAFSHLALLGLFNADNGRLTELRFRSREDGAETD